MKDAVPKLSRLLPHGPDRPARAGRIRRGLVAAAIVVTVPLATACSASFGAATQAPYTPGEGTLANSGDIQLRNLIAVSDEAGRATLVGTIFNQGEATDRLVGIGVPGGRSAASPVELTPGGVAVLGAATGLGEPVQVSLRSPRLKPGGAIRLTFEFEQAAAVSVDVMVVARTGPYATVPPPLSVPSEPAIPSKP